MHRDAQLINRQGPFALMRQKGFLAGFLTAVQAIKSKENVEYGETPWKAGADWVEPQWVYPPNANANIREFRNQPLCRPIAGQVGVIAGRIILSIPEVTQ